MSLKSVCPICQSSTIISFLNRENVPVHQNLVVQDQQSAKEVVRGDLNLTFCQECGFIFNQAFEDSKLNYGDQYDNTQTCSPSFMNYVSSLVHHLVFEKQVQNSRIVEVGCGKGLFLRKLVEVEEWGNIGYGFDPSYIGYENQLEGRLNFEKRYYDSNCANIPADVVVCRHVIEHVPNPLELLHAVRQALGNSSHTRVFFETPCVEWILRNQVIWDFFYEHCSYFNANSLTTAFEASGFKVESVEHIFEGQYLWLEATPNPESGVVSKKSGNIPKLSNRFAASENQLKEHWQKKLLNLTKKGKLAIWGAGAKGVTFANLIDSNKQWIDCVIDLNPNKQGNYVAGTGHPIVGYQELSRREIKVAILMNPNYRQENLTLLREANLEIDLVE